jgi:predicted nucleic acid-binding protein
MSRLASPLVFTALHRIEVRNALRNIAARDLINQEERKGAFRRIEEDLKEGLLVHSPIDWTDVLRGADELSERYSSQDGQRTIDLLHVAVALESGAKTFLTFDKRQRGLAQATGLKVFP